MRVLRQREGEEAEGEEAVMSYDFAIDLNVVLIVVAAIVFVASIAVLVVKREAGKKR